MDNILKKFIRFEVEPEMFMTDSEVFSENASLSGSYEIKVEDVIAACENIITKQVDYETYSNWFWFVKKDLDPNYNISAIITAHNLGEVLIPKTKVDLLGQLFYLLSEYAQAWDYEDDSYLYDSLPLIFETVDCFNYNQTHEESEWKITDEQKHLVKEYYEKHDGKIPKSKRELCRRIIEEGCNNGDHRCMYIKGYATYGGDDVYECDWNESRDLISKLFEETGNPRYANTLGYIYYYGRCNGGVPEYDKAFQYYSVGAAHDLLESMYKIADMFLKGKGIIKSPQTSDHIIQKLYNDCRPRFCWGEDAKFADVALRKAASYQREGYYEEAYDYYLEAKLAIEERLKKSNFFGDRKVQENIEKSLCEVKQNLPADYFREELVMDYPYTLVDFIEGNCKVNIEEGNGNSYRLIVERRKKDKVSRALISIGCLNLVTKTRKLVMRINNPQKIEFKCTDKQNMYFDNIRWGENHSIRFCNKDVEIFSVFGGEYIVRKSDF